MLYVFDSNLFDPPPQYFKYFNYKSTKKYIYNNNN